MAQYLCTARSNYFRVKDAAAFNAWVAQFDLRVWEKDGDENYFAMADTSAEGWPSQRYDEATDDFVELDFSAELAAHLAPDSIAILFEAGAEKLRYVIGVAVAIHPDGRTVAIRLDNIYDLARDAFGKDVQITSAEL